MFADDHAQTPSGHISLASQTLGLVERGMTEGGTGAAFCFVWAEASVAGI